MARGLWQWIEDRWPVSRVVRAVIVEDIPGGGSYWYTTGSTVLFVFILQAVTGVCELFFYVPTVDHAYVSLSFLRISVPYGWLIHNLHYWGATAMVVLLLLHVTQNYLWGAYKNPRQLTWILGVGLFLLVLLMMFTGSPLPWDEKGYWAAEVGTSIAGMTPLVGDFAKRLLQGGETMGQLTLTRFFILHVAILSGLLAALILVHLVAFRRGGSTGPWSESKRRRTGPFWPDQVLMDLVMAGIVFVILIALAAFVPPAYTGAADPADPMFTPKPEWPFLFLYQALKLFPGSLEAAVALGLPLVLTLLLLAWPFLDRRPERNPAKRPGALVIYFGILSVIVALSIIGGMSRPGASGAPAAPSAGTEAGAAQAKPEPAAESGGSAAAAGSGLYYKLGCPTCHSINDVGGKVGPDLAGVKARGRSAAWIEEQIRDPRSHDLEPRMPAFNRLSPSETESLAVFLLSLGGQAGAPEAGASAGPGGASGESGAAIYRRLNCSSCHSINGAGGTAGPDLAAEKTKGRSADWLKEQFSDPRAHDASTIMPAFKLAPAEADALASYLLGLTSKAAGAAPPAGAAAPSAAAGAAPPGPAKAAAPPKHQVLAPELIGNARHGGLLFAEDCARCHGAQGRGGVPNPGSADGTVPPLAPIDRELYDPDPSVFVSKIDPLIQHGSKPEGSRPQLAMPGWGDSDALTQPQISHLEAYVLSLNGVARERIERPGLPPALFFIIVAAVFGGLGLAALGRGLQLRRRKRAAGGGA